MRISPLVLGPVFLGIILIFSGTVDAQPMELPPIEISLGEEGASNWGVGLQLILLLTVLSLAPSIVIMLTSFTRIVVVLSLLRNALATQRMPPNQIIVGLALFLTLFIMSPVFGQINEEAFQPYLAEEIGEEEALDLALQPLREFMFDQVSDRDLALFIEIAGEERPSNQEEVPTLVLVPAFIISELKTAFQIGFLLYIPFIIIDMIVASTLMSMGMLMLPPVMISLPFKILLFVLVDGWYLVIRSLVTTF